ncbi:hypothetical protein FHG87_010724 [Trinorchestia longiramus]|nr:hypothetical protein FHG87_010724 [Trinorchestia longiramus]
MRPVPHSDDLPVPTPPVNTDLLLSSDEEMFSEEGFATSISPEDIVSVYSGASDNEPHWITQEDLNDLARDLYLSKQQSELLASRQWNLVKADVRITSYRTRNKDFASFSDMENRLCYCADVSAPFGSCQVQPVPVESLLGHQGHWASYGYASGLHELLLLSLSMGQSGCGKALRAEGLGSRNTLVPGEHGVQENLLVNRNKVLLPSLHIKLGLMRHFVKAMDRNGAAFQHLYILFPALSFAKLKEGIFVGPQIRERGGGGGRPSILVDLRVAVNRAGWLSTGRAGRQQRGRAFNRAGWLSTGWAGRQQGGLAVNRAGWSSTGRAGAVEARRAGP